MKCIKNKLLSVLAFTTATTGIVAGTFNSNIVSLFAVEKTETWYHYAAVESTCARNGIKEYWTNCDGTTTLVEPEGKSFVERTLTETQINEIVADPSDERLTDKKEHTCNSYVVSSVIGTKNGTCSVCGGSVSALVNNEDIANAGQEWGLCAYFGGNYGAAINPSDIVSEFPEYADLVGRKSSWGNDTAGNVVKTVKLPKVNYTLFDKVSFVIHTNSSTTPTTAIGFGITESGEDLFAYTTRGVRDRYVVSFEYSDGKLSGSVTSIYGAKTFVVDDDAVENGSTPVQIYVKMGAWRRVVLDSVLVNTSEPSATIDDFSAYKYGAEAGIGSVMGVGQDDYTKCLVWKPSTGSALETNIGLPKITYTNYDKVVFNLYVNGGDNWHQILGIDSSRYSKISQNGGHTLTVYRTNVGTYKAKLDLIYGSTRPTFEMDVTDVDVLNGVASLYGVYFKATGQYNNVCITSIDINPAL